MLNKHKDAPLIYLGSKTEINKETGKIEVTHDFCSGEKIEARISFEKALSLSLTIKDKSCRSLEL